MTDKPGTALMVLPPLELIPAESLPKHRTKELALREQVRAKALWQLNKSTSVIAGLMLADILSIVGFLAAVVNGAFIPFMILGITSTLLAAITFIMWQIAARELHVWRQLETPAQLLLDVGDEVTVANAAQLINNHASEWNAAAEKARGEELDEKHLLRLKKSREAIVGRTDQIRKLAQRLNSKGKW